MAGLSLATLAAGFWAWALRRKNVALQIETDARRQAEAALRVARNELAERVDSRTGQLSEEVRARIGQRAAFAAVTKERNRLAGELHDSLEQVLASINLRLEALCGILPCAESRQQLETIGDLLQHGRAEFRSALKGLHAPALERHHLAEAVREWFRLLLDGTGVEGCVYVAGTPRELPQEMENHLLRIAQEAAANSLKHARATRIEITLDYRHESICLTIADDGCGFVPGPPGAGSAGHYGLATMRERAWALGGQFTLLSAPDEGASIVVDLPCAPLAVHPTTVLSTLS